MSAYLGPREPELITRGHGRPTGLCFADGHLMFEPRRFMCNLETQVSRPQLALEH